MRRSISGHGVAAIVAAASLGSAAACSTDFTAATCSTDDDCSDGLVCELRDQTPVCVAAADAPLLIGQSAPASGTNQQLGVEMRRGIELAFAEVNDAGGVRGRQLELVFRDDQYVPDLAEQAAKALTDAQEVQGTAPSCPSTLTPPVAGQTPVATTKLERGPEAVLAILGNVGTPTMVRSGPVAIETGTLFFGAFTGAATLLRDDKGGECAKYIFNVRASYAQEARATVEYFDYRSIPDHEHMISFDQNDSFGQAGYDGLVKAYREVYSEFPEGTDPTTPIARFRYTRNDDASVPSQAAAAIAYIDNILATEAGDHTFGIMMTDTYGAGKTFIEEMRRWHGGSSQTNMQRTRATFYFSNVSFVGPNELAKQLKGLPNWSSKIGPASHTEGVVVSQVVPNYLQDTSEVVADYNRLIALEQDQDPSITASFTSLEGYIAGRIFAAGLLAHEGPFTPETLISSFEELPELSLGLGASAGFADSNHQYSQSVWGTNILPDGTFENLYFWSQGLPITFYE